MAEAILSRRSFFPLHPAQRALLLLNVVGGTAVLGSYWAGFASNPETAPALWGGVPEWLRPLYTVSMLTAATGYFPFATLLLLGVDPERVRVAGRFGFGIFPVLFALILVPSALWMPVTFRILAQWSDGLWIFDRIVLATVGIGSVGLVAALATMSPVASRTWHRLAIAGAVAFCFQTAVLDATVWTAYFPAGVAP